ncbi:MAG: cytochrome c-type biogenesis protein [Pseudoruegeria sp.]
MTRLILILALLFATQTWAVQPDEVLSDPAMEERARDLSKGLRCLVCRNESIDESHADLARDLRLLVRERLVAGDTDAEAMAFIVDRYGEYVLLQPQVSGSNILLWAAGPAMLLLAFGIGFGYLRRRSTSSSSAEAPLSAEEQARLKDILGE